MPAVESLLQLYSLDEKDGIITAFDSYGSGVHLGTSSGQLIRLSVFEASQGAEGKPIEPIAPLSKHRSAPSAAPSQQQAASSGASLRTTVSQRCTLSNSGAAIQQIQHSRSQRVLFVLCEGLLLLLHAEAYSVLSTVATNVVSFSVAQPVQSSSSSSGSTATKDGFSTPPAIASYSYNPSRTHSGWSTGVGGDDEVGGLQYSCTIAHTRTSSEASCGSSQQWTPRCSSIHATAPVATPFTGAQRKSSRAHVVCVAERDKKELAVYLVDRISTTARHPATATPHHASISPPLSAAGLTSGGGCGNAGGGGGSDTPPLAPQPGALPPPPRVVLRQRYVLPEPAHCVIMCSPSPVVARLPTSESNAGTPRPATAATSATVVEAGLTVCVGMRREVSLLPLLGGVPRCVLRLDGSRPPLLSTGSDHNTYLVRTQAPNTVLEVGVPPSAAAAGLQAGLAGDVHVEAVVNPIVLRMGYHRVAATDKDVKNLLAASLTMQRGKSDELIMGDVFQSDDVVELVLARFPFVFLFTAGYCDVVSLLSEGHSSNAGSSSSSTLQRLPLPGVRHGASHGSGRSLFVASDRTLWSLQLYPLRAQLAEMVQAGLSEEAFQLLAFHQQRVLSLTHSTAGVGGREQHPPQPLTLLERDLHRMAGFASLYSGDIASAIRSFRSHLDPRELLLSLPDCIPPNALPFKPTPTTATTATAAPFRAHAEPVPPPLASAAPATPCLQSCGGYALHHVEAPLSAADVRSFLYSGSTTPLTERPCIIDMRAATSSETPSAHASYWEQWSGPCVYNSYVEDVSRAWRAAFDSQLRTSGESFSATAEEFIAHCYDALKDEVRRWFAEELLLTNDEAFAIGACKEPADWRFGGAAVMHRKGLSAGESSPLFSSLPPPARTPVRGRAMAYASLVLAWQARDFHTAYQIVARAAMTGLCVEDCIDMLHYLREYRLLALLYFQAGDGEEWVRLLKDAVCLCKTLLSPQIVAEQALQQPPIDVLAQLLQWRRCMERKFQQGEDNTNGSLNGGGVGAAHSLPPSPPFERGSEPPICGRGLLMQPSVTCVKRVAYLLFGIHADEAVQGTSAKRQGWGRFLDGVTTFYASQSCPPAFAASDSTSFVKLHFAALNNSRDGSPTLPHAGPILTALRTPSFSPEKAAQRGNVRASPPPQCCDPRSALTTASGLRVMPSPFSEYFYAIEKLDVRAVRHLLTQQPRLAQARDLDGSTGLHTALAQVRVVAVSEGITPSDRRARERERMAEWRAATLKVLCALVGLLVHFDCPASLLNCNGWSCMDVAAVACGGDEAVFAIVSAALLAALELRKAELAGA
ncbi:hypothetical protein ABL78_0817 [Leptomonas seymouri]|uniref:Uncharacterized protein n=1 Tax=Leptomonas seymouri TaxID=5684 RepID=A0A0N1PF85_LEPSE|nr:hypothetical protein ABL78_0817 [Leptomonas seymouri]|eukprot:KPI90064.1 hypothetical protein ABL78_0817 [Leptomonas seymouri]